MLTKNKLKKLISKWVLLFISGGSIIRTSTILSAPPPIDQGYLPFTWENRKFQVENQMVRTIPFGKLQKIWAVIWGDAIFLLF